MSPPPRLRGLLHHNRLDLVHGEVVFLPHERVEAVYLVESGGVAVFGPMGEGLLAGLGPLRMIGLRDMLAGGLWQGVGLAQGPTVLRVFDTRPILQMIDAAPDAHRRLLHDLAAA
jgi:hypothetical protein